MKKLTKIMLSLAAASALTMAIAVTAMAADTITGTYDNSTGLVTMDGVIGSGKSQTILVLDGSENISYINQIDNNGTFSTFYLASGLKASAPVTFNIKIGGSDKSLQTGTLTIAADAPVVTTVTIVLGDVTGDDELSSKDVQRLGRYITNEFVADSGTGFAGNTRIRFSDNHEIVLGDVTGDDELSSKDVQRLGRYITNEFVADSGTGFAGNEVEVIAE